MNSAKKFLVGVVAAAGVATGAAGIARAAPAGHAVPAGYHAAACSTSVFTVAWSEAGVHSAKARDSAHLMYTKHGGERVTGPTGGTGDGWTTVYLSNGQIAYMLDASLTYIGCWA